MAIWLAAFVAVNALYLPLVEEPALVRRFGTDYERYMANVRSLAAAPAPVAGTSDVEGAPLPGPLP